MVALARITSPRHDGDSSPVSTRDTSYPSRGRNHAGRMLSICGKLCHIFAASPVTQMGHHTQTPVLMSMYTPTHCPDTGRKFTRAERKAANKAKFQAEQAKLRKSKPAKASKPKQASKPAPTQKALMRLTKAELVAMLMGTQPKRESAQPAPKPKRKPKAKATTKVRKATPQERTADKQERAFHGKSNGVVKPTKVKRTADVQATRELVRSVGATNAKRRAFELATHWAYSPNFGGRFLPSQQEELTRLLGSTDVATYEDVVALTC